MKIYKAGVLQTFPEWITVSDSVGGISSTSEEVNDLDGEVFIGSKVKAKTFTCSGIIISSNEAEVETEIARLSAMLDGEIVMYRTDTSPHFYKCRLQGDIKYTYYNGVRTGKAFQINFSLKAFDPFAYGPLSTMNLSASNTIANTGSASVIPTLTIAGPLVVNGTLISRGSSLVALSESVTIPSGQNLVYNSEGLFLNNVDITDTLTDETLLNPFSLLPGSNSVSYSAGVSAVLTFNPRYR